MTDARSAMVELLRRQAKVDMLAFLQYCWWMPGALHIGRHTRALCSRLTRAVFDLKRGKDTYLIVTLPFRHGKSDLVSRALPAFFLGLTFEEQYNVIMSGYGASLVKGFSGYVQAIVRSEAYRRVFPEVQIDPDKNASDEWRVKDSVATVYAQGLGGSITGKGGNLIIVDDYCKNAEDAESQGIRDKTWESFKTDLCTRVNAPAHIIIVCATRWHMDDIVGRIYAEMEKNPDFPRYETLAFPAHKDGPDGWNTLFPEHYPEKWYRDRRAELGPYQAAALLDCDPRRAGTTVFRDEWWQSYYGELDPSRLNVHLFVDGAKSKRAGADFTTMLVVGRGPDGNYYVLDGVHARLNLAEKLAELFRLVRRWPVRRVWWEQVGAMSDVESVRMRMNDEMFHFSITELHHTTAKDFRIKKLVVPFSQGRIWFPTRLLRVRENADGVRETYDLVAEMKEDEYDIYTGAESTTHDDMIDCLADIMDDEVLAQFTAPGRSGETGRERASDNWCDEARGRRFR